MEIGRELWLQSNSTVKDLKFMVPNVCGLPIKHEFMDSE